MINYFNFKQFDDDYLITNDLGRFAFIDNDQIRLLVGDAVDPDSDLGAMLRERGFVVDGSGLDFVAQHAPLLRMMKAPLLAPTSLHIFVVSTACNLNCVYCQAHDERSGVGRFMDERTVERAVEIALDSPTDELSFEFQGGEPLLNYPVIRHAIEFAELHRDEKRIAYSVVTNLTMLTDEMTEFFADFGVTLSTSLDGTRPLHDANRPFHDGRGSFRVVERAIGKARGAGLRVGGIQTTTRVSLGHAREIVDAYSSLGFDSIFLRPLTPLGIAHARWNDVGYTPAEFGMFYRDALGAILAKNATGVSLREGHASMLLEKAWYGRGVNYMEMRSPCGAGVGQLAYYVNGDVFTCDEARMLHEMGNPSFKLGNVFECDYTDLIRSPVCRATCAASTLESIPRCCDCAYQPYCGTCPVVNMALEGDLISKVPNGYHCGVYSEIFDAVFDIIHRNDENDLHSLRSWFD